MAVAPRHQARHADDGPGPGRWGFQSRGVPVAGPMDPCSHRLANALVGNDRGRRDARDHAGRPGAGVRRRAARRRDRRRVRADRSTDVRRRCNAPFVVVGRIAAALRRARAAARAPTWRSPAGSPCRRCSAAARRICQRDGRRRGPRARAPAIGCRSGDRGRVPAGWRSPPQTADRVVAAGSARAAFACCPARSPIASPPTRSTCCSRRRTSIGHNSNRMGFRLEGPRLPHARRRGHASPTRRRSASLQVPGLRAADSADGRSADDRRLSEDRDGDHRGHRPRRTARPGRHDFVRRLHAGRGDGGADRAGTRADGRRGAAHGDATSSTRCAGRVRRRSRADATSSLAPLTTFRVGGPADWLIETRNSDEIVDGAEAGARGRRAGRRCSAADRTCSCRTRACAGW